MSQTVKEQIDHLMQHHDDDLEGSVVRLQALTAGSIETAELRRVAWLVNHVIGERLGRWPEAHAMQSGLRRPDEPPQSILARGVAAALAGKAADSWQASRDFAARMASSLLTAETMLRLGVLQNAAVQLTPPRCAEEFSACLVELDRLDLSQGLDKIAAPYLNNIVTALIDRPDAMLSDDLYRDAVMHGAAASRVAWQTAGTWVNHERAEYLCALTANAVGDWAMGRSAAQRGLALIAANGSEPVDEAFLSLEQSRAETGLGYHAEATESRQRADALAADFKSAFLSQWFADRVRIAEASHQPANAAA